MIAFLTCVLISTSCGTSTGSVAAVAPVLLPLAHGLGINMGLMCGAIISGAIFGDNLAPISDTTISSALTQEADISQVVRTRFPYAAISGAVAAVLFAVVGLTQDANIPADLELDGSTAKSLFLLVLPVLMVILMRKGWDLMSTLILCNLSGIVLNLVLGTIAPAKMFANDGPIVAGMSGMMTLVLYVTLLFQLLEILNSSGAFDGLTVSLMKHCKSPRSGELICYLVAALGSVVTGRQRHRHRVLRLSGAPHHQGIPHRPLPRRQHSGRRGLRRYRSDAPRQSHAGVSGCGAGHRWRGSQLLFLGYYPL